ncbi:MAG: iron-sulfur cluster assembly accessory protein [Bacteroidia bacterium]|nr:iron-sulfur cluster assembly accessory protein [Bacteroidia bacterium]
MQLRLTFSAAQELRRLLSQKPECIGVRLAVEAGGCAGLTYRFELVETPSPGEQRIEVEGIPFFLQESHKMFLDGVEIDYPTGLAARGFVFSNPQARTTCGCGTSFAI